MSRRDKESVSVVDASQESTQIALAIEWVQMTESFGAASRSRLRLADAVSVDVITVDAGRVVSKADLIDPAPRAGACSRVAVLRDVGEARHPEQLHADALVWDVGEVEAGYRRGARRQC